MRLLHTETRQFKDFLGSQIPQYAILSHRWSDEEVSFKEMRKCVAPAGAGLFKVNEFCRLAASRGFIWCWIDTCCIDKRSSAELSEAINAMFTWYERSTECYVHLGDVQFTPDEITRIRESTPVFEACPALKEQFRASAWFTRGWTLQELIAPQKEKVFFFDAMWNQIGTLQDIINEVSSVTGIRPEFFGLKRPVISEDVQRPPSSNTASIAMRMSWASTRQTSREEDMAYSLLGIFGVNMPLLYGEGAEKAFNRLQLEIMSGSSDESLFAWAADVPYSGMLASSPSAFATSKDVVRQVKTGRSPYAMTNQGLSFSAPSRHEKWWMGRKSVLVYLFCWREGNELPLFIRLAEDGQGDLYRVECEILEDSSAVDSVISPYEFRYLNHDVRGGAVHYIQNTIGKVCRKEDFEYSADF